jgi:biopolymer transport protein TolQ
MATQLESSLQVSDLILQASPVVQLVMLALLLASLFSWYLIAKLHMSYKKAQADDDHFQKIFWSGAELNTLYNNATCISIFNIDTNVEFKFIRHESIPFFQLYESI